MSDSDGFHDVLFPLPVSFGATGGPERRNEIVRLTSGREKRNARFSQSRRSYDAGSGVRSLEDLYDVLAFFEARRGSLNAFRFRDPFDMKSCRPSAEPSALDQALGTGDGWRQCRGSPRGKRRVGNRAIPERRRDGRFGLGAFRTVARPAWHGGRDGGRCRRRCALRPHRRRRLAGGIALVRDRARPELAGRSGRP